jgi:hypothetical protein
MAQSDDLFAIVKSLSKAEKRAFQMYARATGGNKQYLKLFDLMDQADEYHEARMIKRFGKDKKNFAFQKNYLQQQVLYALHELYARSQGQRVEALLHVTQLLAERTLYRQALSQVVKARKLAQEYELPDLQLKAVRLHRDLLRRGVIGSDYESEVDKLFEEEFQLLDQLRNCLEYDQLNYAIANSFRRNIRARDQSEQKQYEALYNNQLISDVHRAQTWIAQLYYHNARFVKAMHEERVSDCVTEARVQLEIFEASVNRIAAMPDRYVAALYNYIKSLVYVKQDDEYLARVDQLCKLPEALPKIYDQPRQRVRLFELSSIARLTYCFKNGKVKMGLEWSNLVEQELPRYALKMNRINRLYLLSFLQSMYFAAGNWKKTLDHNHIIRNEFSEKDSPRLMRIALMVQLIVHYELENMELLQSLIRSAYRYFLNYPSPMRFENAVISFLRNLPPPSASHDLQLKHLQELKRQLEELSNDPFENSVNDFYYLQWLQSKIERKPIMHFTEGCVFGSA